MALNLPPLDPADVWGAQTNANLEDLDGRVDAAQAKADAAIPKSPTVAAIVAVTQAEHDALVTAGTTVATTLYVRAG